MPFGARVLVAVFGELVFRLFEAAGLRFLVGDFLDAGGDLVLLTMAEDPLVEVIRLFCDRE